MVDETKFRQEQVLAMHSLNFFFTRPFIAPPCSLSPLDVSALELLLREDGRAGAPSAALVAFQLSFLYLWPAVQCQVCVFNRVKLLSTFHRSPRQLALLLMTPMQCQSQLLLCIYLALCL